MITTTQLLNAYAKGYFPMAESRESSELYWFYPEQRGIIPLDGFHIPRSLAKLLKHAPYEVRVDTAFTEVMRHCAKNPLRESSWINEEIIRIYTELHAQGHAHSVECWDEDGLVGGLYGVSLGGAFFGESMFSLKPNASKVALVHLVERLQAAGYQLLDTQYINDHLKQFGVIEIPRDDYLERLTKALQLPAKW